MPIRSGEIGAHDVYTGAGGCGRGERATQPVSALSGAAFSFRPQASGTLQSNPRGQYASHDRDNSRPGSQGPLATKVWCRSSIRTTYEPFAPATCQLMHMFRSLSPGPADHRFEVCIVACSCPFQTRRLFQVGYSQHSVSES